MSESRERMIDAAVRIHGDNVERKMAAKGWLEATVPDMEESAADRVTERWNQIDATKRRISWQAVTLTIALLSLVVLWAPARRILDGFAMWQATGVGGAAPSGKGENWFRNLSTGQKLLIGDPAASEIQNAEALWRSEPSNPAFFAEYASAHQRAFAKLPDDYFKIAASIDPDNAWFDIVAAGILSSKAVENTTASRSRHLTAKWKINRPQDYHQALVLLRGSRTKKTFRGYSEELTRSRIALLPQSTPEERLRSLAYLSSQKTPYFSILNLSKVIAARAEELGDSGEKEEFRSLREDTLALISYLSVTDDPTLIGDLIVRISIITPLKNIREAAVKLGLDDDPRFARWDEEFTRSADERSARKASASGTDRLISEKGSYLASVWLPLLATQVKGAPEIRAEELAPARLSEHAMLSEVSVAALAVLFSLMIVPVFLYRFRSSLMVRKMAERIERLLKPVDWWWIFVVGIVLPCIITMLLIAFTPIGGRDISLRMSLKSEGVFLPAAQFAMMATILILLTVLIARWRLRLRAGMFGFGGKDWIGWIVVVAQAGVMIGYLHFPNGWSWGIAAAVTQLGLIVWIARALFSAQSRVLGRIVISRLLMTSFAVAILCMVSATFGFGFLGQYWFEKDEFMKLTPDAPSMFPYEYKISQQLRKETREILEMR